jgi:hypothetical protein
MSVTGVMRWSGMRRGVMLRGGMRCMLIAAVVVVAPVVLGEGNTTHCQKCRRDGNNNRFSIHSRLR